MNNNGIIYDDDGSAGIALMARPMADVMDYMASTVNSYVSAVGQTASGLAQDAMERFNYLRSNEFLGRVDHLRRRLNTVWQTDEFRELTTLDQLQEAPRCMQRWLMACPDLREYYNDGGCAGYDYYEDRFPNTIGRTHYDYRRVMDGVFYRNDEGKVMTTEYLDSLLDRDDLLTIVQKNAIQTSWQTMKKHLEESNMDPTSLDNEKLS